MKKKILVAPLNWGLGHATRCIPIITALLKHNYTPLIASDGAALTLLKKEFPDLETYELPAYGIIYPKNGRLLKYKLLKDAPKILKAIKAERRAINHLVNTHDIDGIISDNRYGVFHPKVSSVFMTHQLRVFSGSTTWFSTKIHTILIARFDQCWVPDVMETPNLSGEMSHNIPQNLNVIYIGPLSRFQKISRSKKYDVFILLSGPEPQRSFLERKLIKTFKNYPGRALMVKGVIEDEQRIVRFKDLTIYNFMTSQELEIALNESNIIICRSGYSTIMDLAILRKKAFFIPTPGQYEQNYLALRMEKNNLAPYCEQEEFSLEKLQEVTNCKGLKVMEYHLDFKKLFDLFERE